jgi:hypothetical protein
MKDTQNNKNEKTNIIIESVSARTTTLQRQHAPPAAPYTLPLPAPFGWSPLSIKLRIFFFFILFYFYLKKRGHDQNFRLYIESHILSMPS